MVEVTEESLKFLAAAPELELKYVDVGEMNGDVCAIKLHDFKLMKETIVAAGLDETCCFELETKTAS